MYTIYAAKDERTCEICGNRHEKKYKIDKRPILPFHPNCRCTYLPVIDFVREKEHNKNIDYNKGNRIQEIVGDSTKYQVTREIINSEEYKQKFSNIGSKKQNEVTCKETKRIVKRNDGTNNENYSIIDNKGNIIITSSAGRFGGDIDISVLEGYKENSVAFTHNHPLSTSFSDDDLELLMDTPQIKTIIAAGHNGTIYKLSVGKGIRTEMSKTTGRNSIVQEYIELFSAGKTPNEIIEILSEIYGWKYEVI